MVFELAGRLRYHALWAYTALVGLFVGLDKVPVDDTQGLALVLAPIGLILTADVIKNRNSVAPVS
jgi:predicted branched-subunit amino acid permease